MSEDGNRINNRGEESSSKSKDKGASGGIGLPTGLEDLSVESIRRYLAERLGISLHKPDDLDGARSKVLETVDMDGLIKHWKNGGFKKIITMVGAGISTSAGIPDFRSPETGLYNNLQKYNLPYPGAIFEMDYFRENPKPFFTLAKELYPGGFKPTLCHFFIKMLDEKGLLRRHYTQNIDTLERITGLDADRIVEAHGTFYTNHCLECRKEYSMEWMKEQIFKDDLPVCECNGIVKPDIVFFGENLPESFHQNVGHDFDECDLLIIMGTSLEVQPFASLVERVNSKCVRLLINREPVGGRSLNLFHDWFNIGSSLNFNGRDNWRDVAWIGNCDDGVLELATKLGFGDELLSRVQMEHNRIDEAEKRNF